jgi:hypothetical protein
MVLSVGSVPPEQSILSRHRLVARRKAPGEGGVVRYPQWTNYNGTASILFWLDAREHKEDILRHRKFVRRICAEALEIQAKSLLALKRTQMVRLR